MAINPLSPWSKSDFRDANEPFSKKGTQTALRLPDGKILINYENNTSEEMLQTMARLFKAEIILVRGTWTFVADREEEDV